MAAIRSRKDRNNQDFEQRPASATSASLYRSRALIQSLTDAANTAKVEGPPVPGSAHATPSSSSLKSKLELLGPADGEELMSEGQRQLQQLLRKQLDTSTSFEKMLEDLQSKEFTPAVVFKPMANEVKGLHSLEDYQSKEQEYAKLDKLRQLGLTAEEMKLKKEDDEELHPGPAKRSRLGADPKAQRDRLEALNQKLLEKEKALREPIKYAGVMSMSRHAIEVERSLFRETSSGNPLQHLTVEDHQHAVLYPKSVIPDKSSVSEGVAAGAGAGDGAREELGKEAAATSSSTVAPNPLPIQIIERNRLSVAEIRALPRFRDYSPGVPNKVLFLKNLHHKVTEEDLCAVFGCFQKEARDGQVWPSIRVMSGRMKGQAFVEFDSATAAVKAMELINGYIMREKPLIICYGRTSS